MWYRGIERTLKDNKFAILFIILFAVLSYSNIIGNSFLWDDVSLIVENENLKDPAKNINFIRDFWWLNEADKGSPYFRPIISIEYIVDYRIWGLDPFGFHLTNIILLCLGAVAVLFLTDVLFKDRMLSFLAAALFAVHPVHTENVTWIAGRTDVTMAMFYLWALFMYIRWRKTDGKGYLFGSLLMWFCSILSKEVAVTFPVAIILYDWCFEEKTLWNAFRTRWKVYLGFASVIVLYQFIRFWALEYTNNFIFLGSAFAYFAKGEFFTPIMKILYSIGNYIFLNIYPSTLKIRWVIPEIDSLFSWASLFALGICIPFFILMLHSWRKSKKHFFLLAFFMLNILLVANIITVRDSFAERFVYLASLSFCILIPMTVRWLVRNKKTAFVIITIIIVLFGARTYVRNYDWHDQTTLVTKELSVNSGSAEANFLYGSLYAKNMNNLSVAKEYFEKAIAIDDKRTDAHLQLGLIYQMEGNVTAAFESFEKCKIYGPPEFIWKGAMSEGLMLMDYGFFNVANNNSEIARRNFVGAVENFRMVLSQKAYIPDFHLDLASAYLALNDFSNAGFEIDYALRLDPNNQQAQIMKKDMQDYLYSLQNAVIKNQQPLN